MNIRKLKEEQIRLSQKVIVSDVFDKIETIGGVFQTSFENRVICSIVVCDYRTLKLIERAEHVEETDAVYIPGFLSYSIATAVINAYHKLKTKPQMLICNFPGIHHPRRIGPASHIGLLLDIPTIGVAHKSPCGDIDDDKIIYDKEVRAQAIMTREHAKPIFVSPGHRVSMKSSIEIVEKTLIGHKMPEPLHIARVYMNKLKKELGIRK